jgi:DNA polymerase-3 subunit epsilon
MKGLDYVAIDFETANTYANSACSIGLVRFFDGEEVASLYSLIHPAKMYFIPEWTEEIHHISYDDVRNKPQFPEIWNTLVVPFLAQAPGLPLVAHNAPFDMNVIRGCMDYFGMPVPELHYFDSRRVAQRTWPDLECHQLTYLGENFLIKYNAHDALDDARTCGKIIHLAAKAQKVASVDKLLNICGLELRQL